MEQSLENLKFLHIPKTAGTTIECVGVEQAELKWGYHDFNYLSKFKPKVCFRRTRPGDARRLQAWHCPLQWFEAGNPYSENTVFTVIRNPLSRVVSNFGCPFVGTSWGNSAHDLNCWVPQLLTDLRENPYLYRGHFISLTDFVYDANGSRMVDHILRFESLNEDFNHLMKIFDAKLTLNRHDNRGFKKLTSNDLSAENRLLIYDFYESDFDNFYPNEFEKTPR